MKKLLMGALCALLCFGCSDEKKDEQHVVVKKQEQPQYVPPQTVNPFDKTPPPPRNPLPPHVVQVGDPFKINDHWSFYLERDEANHNLCYIVWVDQNSAFSMSCVKE